MAAVEPRVSWRRQQKRAELRAFKAEDKLREAWLTEKNVWEDADVENDEVELLNLKTEVAKLQKEKE